MATEQEKEKFIQSVWKTMGPFDGYYLSPPPVRPWEETLKALREMKLRDDDVILFTYPKAGTNWMWEIITMLRRGTAEYDKDTKEQFCLEYVHDEILEGLPSPRTLNTHLPVCMLPVSEMKARQLKVVHVYRNPKSTCVSLYHMAKAAPVLVPLPIDSFEHFYEDYFFGTKQLCGSYFNYFRQLHAFQQENPDVPFINLSYEDAKKDPVGCVKKLAQFLCLTVSDELCSQIAQACSFDNMKKKTPEKAVPNLGKLAPEMEDSVKDYSPIMYRKGEVSDWKNHFTVALNERVDDLIEKEMEGLPFTLTFE